MNRFAAILLVLCMALSLCACGGSNDVPETTEAPVVTTVPTEAEVETEATVAEGMTVYTVTVVDEGGNPISGVIVQWCLETCFPGFTNADGYAEYTAPEADYHVQINSMPEGYTYSTEETDFYYEAGSTDMTIVLKAVA